MNSITKEWISIVAMLALTVFFHMQMPARPEAGASLFPGLIMALMAGMAGIKAVVLLLAPPVKKAGTTEPRPLKRFFFVLASIIVYVAMVDIIGFYVSSFLFFFFVTLAVQMEKLTLRSIAIRFIIVTGFLLFLYILFSRVLMAQLPKGILF